MKLTTGAVPKETAVAPNRPVPRMETVRPPLVVPDAGLSEVIVGFRQQRSTYLPRCPSAAVSDGEVHCSSQVGAGREGLDLRLGENGEAQCPCCSSATTVAPTSPCR